MNGKEARRAEAILREYLLRAADQVCLQRMGSSWLSVLGSGHSRGLKKFLKLLQAEDIADIGEHELVFNLTEHTRQLFNQASLLFTGTGKLFNGLADPKFTKQGKELAYLVTNEKLLSLYISDSDKQTLSQQGVYLDSPEI